MPSAWRCSSATYASSLAAPTGSWPICMLPGPTAPIIGGWPVCSMWTCSSSMTLGCSPWRPRPCGICTTSSVSAMSMAPSLSPATAPSRSGRRLSTVTCWPALPSIDSPTTPTPLSSTGRAIAKPVEGRRPSTPSWPRQPIRPTTRLVLAVTLVGVAYITRTCWSTWGGYRHVSGCCDIPRVVVGREGLEPSWSHLQRILSPQRLPFRHRPKAATSIAPAGLIVKPRGAPRVPRPPPMFSSFPAGEVDCAGKRW